ncbi:MAG: ester cyclase [Pseudomonadota bacterium]
MPARIVVPLVSTLTAGLLGLVVPCSLQADEHNTDIEQRNKARAIEFYQDLWFSNNTDRYAQYMADTYVAHDIGDRKNVTEPAVEQQLIADFFWENGEMSGEVDYQIADGDLVATRWIWRYRPTTLLGHLLTGKDEIPIINVFRFKDGKIVELWNHRHDIDTGMTTRFTLQGLVIGLAVALVPLFWALSLRRRLKKLQQAPSG